VLPIAGLFRWRRQQGLNQCDVKVQQECTVKQQEAPASPLGVSGKFQPSKRQVGVAFDGHRTIQQPFERGAIALHDEPVCGRDAVQRITRLDFQNQRVVQTTRSLQHRAAPGTASQNRHATAFAARKVDLRGNLVRVTDSDEMLRRLPESQDLAGFPCFSRVEQRLVAGEVFRGRGQSQVENIHPLRPRA
jgi:hypothetical protein